MLIRHNTKIVRLLFQNNANRTIRENIVNLITFLLILFLSITSATRARIQKVFSEEVQL